MNIKFMGYLTLAIAQCMAKIKLTCVGVFKETWHKGDRQKERNVTSINLLDMEPHLGHQMKNTSSYTPSEEELKDIDFDKLVMQPVILAVTDPFVANNRTIWRGTIDRSSLPKVAFLDKGQNTPSSQARP